MQSDAQETTLSVVGYTHGRTLYFMSIYSRNDEVIQIRREARLTSFEMAYDDQRRVQIAMGDERGKVFHVINALEGDGSKGHMIVKTLHWHANAVTGLKFLENTPYLLSVGSEAVVVQWHLDKQDKTFISRLGSRINCLALSQRYDISSSTYFACILSDNTLKVVRIDNNKTVLATTKPQYASGELQSVDSILVSANGTRLHFVDLNSEFQLSQHIESKPRNFVTTENSDALSKVVAFCMTNNKRNLVTLEQLKDSRTDIEVASLKFWRKSQDDFTDF